MTPQEIKARRQAFIEAATRLENEAHMFRANGFRGLADYPVCLLLEDLAKEMRRRGEEAG